jgi:hypothetical protein
MVLHAHDSVLKETQVFLSVACDWLDIKSTNTAPFAAVIIVEEFY